jgi:predicted metal-dependent peptidase
MHENLMKVGRDMHVVELNIRLASELAFEILDMSRDTLLLNLRYLDRALVRFIPADSGITATIATNGQYLYFNPTHILRCYKIGKKIPPRDYLHVTLHCLFRHLFISQKLNMEIWDLACDIAVENIIDELHIPSLHCLREERQAEVIAGLKEAVHPLTAEKLYRYFTAQEAEPGELAHMRGVFYADDHQLWHDENAQYLNQNRENTDDDTESALAEEGEQKIDAQGGEPRPNDTTNDDADSQAGRGPEEDADDNEGKGIGSTGDTDNRQGDKPNLTRAELEEIWQDISERVQVDLDTQPTTWGQSDGSMLQQLRAVNREKTNYTNFLRHFSVFGENMEVNDEEFDLIFYTYGMERYGNMPLIEPLEYKEVKRVREFVIALDTSESVENDLVQKFVTKTYNILKQSDSFFTKTNIHIIQCGASVNEDVKITCEDDFDEYLRHMTLKGFGGTDFRPVFEYVDKLIEQKEFTNLKGLIYFTDGYGTYPVDMPQYDAAFVFVDDAPDERVDLPDIPVWAAKVILRRDDIDLF